MSFLLYASITISLIAVGITIYTLKEISYQRRKIDEQISSLKEDVNDLKVTDQVYVQGDWDEDELFESNIMELAEKLTDLLKSKHQLENVTTYSDMVDFLREMNVEDNDMQEEIINFYEKVIKIEYSGKDLSQDEKERLKNTAVDLIKKTGQSQEVQKSDKEEE